MIFVIIGTKAQLIKMAPVMVALRDQGLTYRFISTGQHRETTDDILDNFGLRGPDHILYEGPDITAIGPMARWGFRILWLALRRKEEIFGQEPKGLVLVHGDTFSTLLGAIMGRAARLKVGHVESGLRSFRWFHPFPEEVTRLLTFRLTHVHFCPGPWAIKNLRGYRGEKIDVEENTLKDALGYALKMVDSMDVSIPVHPYAVVSVHRFENIYSRKALERIANTVKQIAKRIHVLFILHKVTEKSLRRHELLETLQAWPSVEFRQRYDYFRFIKLVSGSEFVVSDGGSNQEECHYLGKPILLLREATERHEGLGTNCVLSKNDPGIITDFIDNYELYAKDPASQESSPSRLIANYCSGFRDNTGEQEEKRNGPGLAS